MKNRKKLKKIAAKSVKLSFKEGSVHKLSAEEVIRILKTLPRAQAIYAISKFLKGFRRRSGETTLTIESAVPLSKLQLGSIVKRLSGEFVITEVVNKINPDLLGGMKIKIGDTIIDYSLEGRMQQIGRMIES